MHEKTLIQTSENSHLRARELCSNLIGGSEIVNGRRVGLIGGGATLAVLVALAGSFAVANALTIEDQRGVAVNTPPVVVGTAVADAPTATPTPEPSATPVEVVEPPVVAPPVEVETAPKPAPVAPPTPVAPAVPVAPAPPAVVVPPVDAPRPEWPAGGDRDKWSTFATVEEAAAWAKAQGWTRESVREWLRDYAERRGWDH